MFDFDFPQQAFLLPSQREVLRASRASRHPEVRAAHKDIFRALEDLGECSAHYGVGCDGEPDLIKATEFQEKRATSQINRAIQHLKRHRYPSRTRSLFRTGYPRSLLKDKYSEISKELVHKNPWDPAHYPAVYNKDQLPPGPWLIVWDAWRRHERALREPLTN